ncbi:UPF0061 protein xcc-b100_1894 [Eumeta japonica]|uniref:Selenoprotein O n=1 Tax=Eumeta variegata TaxID=151549 RepID=A0A4C1ZRX4_EUMVA|nr:UPF0061 protein xcc-b100_1894 [Eumeta japonica]
MKRALCLCAVLLDSRKIVPMASNLQNLVNNFKDWKFKSPPSYASLPIDSNPDYTTPTAVKNAVFSLVPTQPISGNIRLVCASEDALKDILDLNPDVAESQEFIDFITGKILPEGGLCVSHRYGGYQFGFWADQLGDGRAHVLGEYINSKGESWQLQLKGSGETPYSRFGDGRAVLRSSIREMVASEACYFLGVPTTRAAALVVSDEKSVWRDKNYSGMTKQERAAVVLRLAPCWYRIGSLEILTMRKEHELLKKLCDFIIKEHFPEIDYESEDKYVTWFKRVAHKNLDMVATWQGFGFTHGVLNTDNISLLGLTIDYGPYGFIDHYYQFYVPNTSDDGGRYAFNKQPTILIWNLEKMYKAMAPILTDAQKQQIEEFLPTLNDYVERKVLETYLRKLGLHQCQDGDEKFVHAFLELMQQKMADFTATFKQLGELNPQEFIDKNSTENKWSLNKLADSGETWKNWVQKYEQRLASEGVTEEERRARMSTVNPAYVPRNWMLQEAIADAENDDFKKVKFLLEVLRRPFEVNEEAEKQGFSSPPPTWSYGLKLSCSS